MYSTLPVRAKSIWLWLDLLIRSDSPGLVKSFPNLEGINLERILRPNWQIAVCFSPIPGAILRVLSPSGLGDRTPGLLPTLLESRQLSY